MSLALKCYTCCARSLRLRVQAGKLDADFDFGKDMARARTNNLPGNFQGAQLTLVHVVYEIQASVYGSCVLVSPFLPDAVCE